MEHQNNVTTATTSGMTQVHELGHQWFGNKVTTRDWQHGWLNEGFATYSEALYKEATQGTSSYHNYMNQMKWGWNDNNTVFTTDTIGVWDIFDIIIYYKGAWVNHMLRHIVEDSTYFEALRDYLDIYSGGNVVTEDLETVIESHYGTDLNWFFDQWIYGNGHPEYDFLWAGSSSKVKIGISQQATGSYPDVFTMPLDTRMRGANDSEEIQTIWVDQENANFLLTTDFQPTSITLDPNGWVLGYYSGSEVGLLGDINVDNQVNILDIIGTANYILSQTELTEDQFFLMDVDGDNTITIMDIIQIVNIILDNTA
jgi:aminopeptidase N